MRRVRLNNSLAQGNARGQRPGRGCLLYLCLDEAAFLTRTGLVRPVRLSAWHLGPSVRLPFSPISMCPDRLCEHIFWMLDFTKTPAVTLHWDEFVLYPSQSPRPLPGTWVFFASLPISPFPLPRLAKLCHFIAARWALLSPFFWLRTPHACIHTVLSRIKSDRSPRLKRKYYSTGIRTHEPAHSQLNYNRARN